MEFIKMRRITVRLSVCALIIALLFSASAAGCKKDDGEYAGSVTSADKTSEASENEEPDGGGLGTADRGAEEEDGGGQTAGGGRGAKPWNRTERRARFGNPRRSFWARFRS